MCVYMCICVCIYVSVGLCMREYICVYHINYYIDIKVM